MAISGDKSTFKCVGFEVLTAVLMKSTIFWDITSCSRLSTDVSEEQIVGRVVFNVASVVSRKLCD
jgi:hypothetical protein